MMQMNYRVRWSRPARQTRAGGRVESENCGRRAALVRSDQAENALPSDASGCDKEVAMKSIHRILFATDFSPASTPALDRAIDLAKDDRAELIITHVYEPPSRLSLDGYVLPQIYDEFETALREEAESALAPLVERAKAAGVEARALLVKGIPYRAIARAARANMVDLVVLGTHGRTGMARLFLGSVAARVISTAPCPVLTVRAA